VSPNTASGATPALVVISLRRLCETSFPHRGYRKHQPFAIRYSQFYTPDLLTAIDDQAIRYRCFQLFLDEHTIGEILDHVIG
jgi:hypothetical protein